MLKAEKNTYEFKIDFYPQLKLKDTRISGKLCEVLWCPSHKMELFEYTIQTQGVQPALHCNRIASVLLSFIL